MGIVFSSVSCRGVFDSLDGRIDSDACSNMRSRELSLFLLHLEADIRRRVLVILGVGNFLSLLLHLEANKR